MKNKSALTVATWFKSGLIPPPKFMSGMAGTYGSFFTLPLCWLVLWAGKLGLPSFHFFIIAVIFTLGIWSIPWAEIMLGPRIDWRGKTKTRDQNQIVIDEVFGMLVTCYPLQLIEFKSYWIALTLTFVFFRFFDIVKVPPIQLFDDIKNEWGVMLDDFMAGFYAAICTGLTVWVFEL